MWELINTLKKCEIEKTVPAIRIIDGVELPKSNKTVQLKIIPERHCLTNQEIA